MSAPKPAKHTDLRAEANHLLARRCWSNTCELHLITVILTHLQSPNDGRNINSIQFKLNCSLRIINQGFGVDLSRYNVNINTQKSRENESLKPAYQDWNSALVHSNLWSLFRKPVSPGRRLLNSKFGVLTITATGVIKPNTTSEKRCTSARVRCSILETAREVTS